MPNVDPERKMYEKKKPKNEVNLIHRRLFFVRVPFIFFLMISIASLSFEMLRTIEKQLRT